MDEHILWQISLSLQIKTVSICRASRVSFVLLVWSITMLRSNVSQKNICMIKKIWSHMAGYMNLPRVRLFEDRKFRKKKREENLKMEGWTWVWGEDTFKSSVKQQVGTSQQGGRILGNGLPLTFSSVRLVLSPPFPPSFCSLTHCFVLHRREAEASTSCKYTFYICSEIKFKVKEKPNIFRMFDLSYVVLLYIRFTSGK